MENDQKKRLEILQEEIKKLRVELDQLIVEDDFEALYEKNLQMDQLIGEYYKLKKTMS